VLLRFAIGWHFGYEGAWKFKSWQKGSQPFSAEGYLRNASGPLAPYFRAMVPDVNGLETLDYDRLTKTWADDVARVADHFGYNDEQKAKANAFLADSDKWAREWFLDRENSEKRAKYYHDLRAVQLVEQNPNALTNQREWAAAQRKVLDTDRKDVTKELTARGAALRESVLKMATREQAEASGDYRPAPTLLDLNNVVTALSLVIIGFCLMAGLFSRLAALGGVAFLALIYLCMPPWPGLPPNPLAEGHFAYVDKNLIELLALLALAALPTGHWFGVDAVLFGWWRRSRERARTRAGAEPTRSADRTAHAVS
jgi:uncharacterized membrane protein YphA (DoxX/SURF4 family)